MPIKFRSVVKSPKSYGYKLSIPQAKFSKIRGSNARSQEFAKSRGQAPLTSTNIKWTKQFFEKRPKLKISRSELIPAKEWQFYVGDLVQVVAGRLVNPVYPKRFDPLKWTEASIPTYHKYLKIEHRQGKVLELDYNRNLLRVEGIFLTRKHTAATPYMPSNVYDVHNWIHYKNLALVNPSTNQPCHIEWKKLPRSTLDTTLVWQRCITDTQSTIPLPVEHKSLKLKDQDNPSKSKKTPECSTLKELNLSYNPENGSDVHSNALHSGHY